MINSKLTKLRRVFLLSISLIYALLIYAPIRVNALTKEALDGIRRGTYWYDPTYDACPGGSGQSGPIGGEVFLIGDSIAEGDQTELTSSLKAKGFSKVTIDAKASRRLSEGSSDLDGISVLASDKSQYTSASYVIIELGTNGGVTADNINKAISTVKIANSNTQIYWVNIGADNSKRDGAPIDFSSINSILQQNTSAGYSIIDWSSQVQQHPEYIDSNPSTGLGVHPSTSGKTAFADTVANGLNSGGGNLGSCSCAGASSGVLPATIPESYRTLFTQAAQKYGIDPNFLAAIFLDENGNVWKPFDTNWATSSAGATGPFQFLPSTWSSYQTDGNGDGVMDINNIYDTSYAVASWISQAGITQGLGDISKPFANPNTFLYFSAAYNWGPGNVQMHTTPDSPLSVAPTETQNYVNNSYQLVSSGFTKSGNPNYGDPAGSGAASGQAPPVSTGACSGGDAANKIVQTALNYAWPDQGHGPNRSDAKNEYADAHDQFDPLAGGNYSGCDIFVSTVMHSTNVDPNYPTTQTSVQQPYAEGHPEKYQIIGIFHDTSQLKPGDILIYYLYTSTGIEGHTIIYVGPQSTGFNAADASNGGHVPQAQNIGAWNVGIYTIIRVKG